MTGNRLPANISAFRRSWRTWKLGRARSTTKSRNGQSNAAGKDTIDVPLLCMCIITLASIETSLQVYRFSKRDLVPAVIDKCACQAILPSHQFSGRLFSLFYLSLHYTPFVMSSTQVLNANRKNQEVVAKLLTTRNGRREGAFEGKLRPRSCPLRILYPKVLSMASAHRTPHTVLILDLLRPVIIGRNPQLWYAWHRSGRGPFR